MMLSMIGLGMVVALQLAVALGIGYVCLELALRLMKRGLMENHSDTREPAEFRLTTKRAPSREWQALSLN